LVSVLQRYTLAGLGLVTIEFLGVIVSFLCVTVRFPLWDKLPLKREFSLIILGNKGKDT